MQNATAAKSIHTVGQLYSASNCGHIVYVQVKGYLASGAGNNCSAIVLKTKA